MRLVGASFAGQTSEARELDGIVMDAVRQLNGEGLSRAEGEARRDALIQGYRWILVDEYQDIGPEEYVLISALAGRSLGDPDLRLSLFAVGDHDQNIYAFAGASIEYIRKFEEDYRARPEFLTENYRSTRNIIETANAVIAPARNRRKAGHDSSIALGKTMEPVSGDMAGNDAIAHGRVQVPDCPAGEVPHATAALDESVRPSRLDPEFRWNRTVVGRAHAPLRRSWREKEPRPSCRQ